MLKTNPSKFVYSGYLSIKANTLIAVSLNTVGYENHKTYPVSKSVLENFLLLERSGGGVGIYKILIYQYLKLDLATNRE